jgi:hypothetical protein
MLHHGLTLPIEAHPGHAWRMDRDCASLSQRHGAEFLDGDLGVFDELSGDDRSESLWHTEAGIGAGGPGAFADAEAGTGSLALVAQAGSAGVLLIVMVVALNIIFR